VVDTEPDFYRHMNKARIYFMEGLKVLTEAEMEALKKGGPRQRNPG